MQSSAATVAVMKNDDRKFPLSQAESFILSSYFSAPLVAGSLAGCISSIVVSPLDVLKTRLQSSDLKLTGITKTNRHYAIFTCLRNILQTEGVRGMFKGLLPTLSGIVPCRAIYFHFYANHKEMFSKLFNCEENRSHVHLCASCTASLITTTAVTPLFFVRTRLQLIKGHKSDIINVIKCAFHEGGLRIFYRGIGASYFGALEGMFFFVSYEKLKSKMDVSGNNDLYKISGSAVACKLLASTMFYPHEVIRTRQRQPNMQQVYSSVWQTCRTIVREEGIKALYAGLKTSFIRQIPNVAVTMSVYEFFLAYLKNT
ncbi:hypothetical protein GJ496_008741 [Pomphorhynchus laevis]|nr:hypothetical protein GJ496_008741 [Pomphorhynchus laevis]